MGRASHLPAFRPQRTAFFVRPRSSAPSGSCWAQVPTNSMRMWSSANMVETTPPFPLHRHPTANSDAEHLLEPPLALSCSMRSVGWRNGSVWSSYCRRVSRLRLWVRVPSQSMCDLNGIIKNDFCRIRTVRPCDGRLAAWRDSADTAGTQGKQVMSDCNVRGSNLGTQARDLLRLALPWPIFPLCCVYAVAVDHHIPSSRVAPFVSSFFLCRGFFAVATCQIRPAPALLLLLLPVPLCFSWPRKNPAVATTNTINLFLPRPNPHAPDDKRDVTTARRRSPR